MRRIVLLALLSLTLVGGFVESATGQVDALPSWNEGPSKKAIVEFVKQVTKEGSPNFVAPAERIAVLDNDGTLWSEQPAYFQLLFAIDRVKALAATHPEWKDQEPFKSVLAGDMKGVLAGGKPGLAKIIMMTHAGMTSQEFDRIVKEWIGSARHPRFKRPYTELVYQPMLELLSYLRAQGFKTYIVSGSGVEFLRAWAEKIYGVPPEQTIGSRLKLKWELRDGKPALLRLPDVDFIDDKEGKPIGIQQNIGRRPILAFGNSDGDHEMLQWTAAGTGLRFMGIVHHTDAEREWAYDRESSVGRLDKALDDARQKGWLVVDMKRDWKVVFPFEAK